MLNGCVSVISMDSAKVLDVEPLSQVCKKCWEHENDADIPQSTAWWADHGSKCRANYQGSEPNMATEDVLRIFSLSIRRHQLLHSEYYGDGGCKSFQLVKDQDQVYHIEVEKKECVGHVQKRLGTALRKLKREKKGMGGKGR